MLMNIVIFVVYSLKVVPVVIDSFYSTVGDKADVHSRMNSVRQISWLQGDDNTWLQIGFKLDRYMNSVYIAAINVLMLCRYTPVSCHDADETNLTKPRSCFVSHREYC